MFSNAIFAGGGSRCFWQLGFWWGANRAGLKLRSQVRFAAATSAGSAVALAAMLGREEEALAAFQRMARDNPGNLHWRNLKPGSHAPVLPHMVMFRSIMAELLTDQDLGRLADRELVFLIARCPPLLPGALSALLGFSTYGLEKWLTGRVHPEWSRRLGFAPIVASSRDARTTQELTDMVLASSCVPPLLPSPPYKGERILDGGMIDNVPAFLTEGHPGRTLVLLSKRYRRPLPEVVNRLYLQPSEPITLDKFDYADPEGLQRVFDLGCTDGQRFAAAQTPSQL
ncbi:MAG: patatin-like phospholipase family protein [Pseudomonadota bacterium]